MIVSTVLLSALWLQGVASIGFTTYRQILEGSDNSWAISYNALDRSSTIFLYIQIIAGWDHSQPISDFKTLAQNYGTHGVSVIPRVRYGYSNGSVATEPSDQTQLLNDVSQWASVFASVSGTINIPVIQAGFLGEWGEWHGGPFCQAQGQWDTPTNLAVKKQVVQTLLTSGRKVAMRYPVDHQALFPNSRTVTLHDDCIFDGGPTGYDGGTFPSDSRDTWVAYTKQVAAGNTFGGEGCNDAGDATYNWSDYGSLCGSNGLAAYIDAFQIAYLNPATPTPLQSLFNDPSQASCVNAIMAALARHS